MAPKGNIFSTMTEQNFTTIAERLGVRARDLVDATEDAMRLEDHHTWRKRTAERLGGLMRTKKHGHTPGGIPRSWVPAAYAVARAIATASASLWLQ